MAKNHKVKGALVFNSCKERDPIMQRHETQKQSF